MSTASPFAPLRFVSARDEAQEIATLWVVGELDEFTIDAFEAELERLVRVSRSLIVELSSCTFISSVGLAALMRIRRRLPDVTLVLVTESAHLVKLIRIAGLEPHFPRFDNVVDALLAVSGHASRSNAPLEQTDARQSPARPSTRREVRIAHEGELYRSG